MLIEEQIIYLIHFSIQLSSLNTEHLSLVSFEQWLGLLSINTVACSYYPIIITAHRASITVTVNAFRFHGCQSCCICILTLQFTVFNMLAQLIVMSNPFWVSLFVCAFIVVTPSFCVCEQWLNQQHNWLASTFPWRCMLFVWLFFDVQPPIPIVSRSNETKASSDTERTPAILLFPASF